jgi:hypothetical protein
MLPQIMDIPSFQIPMIIVMVVAEEMEVMVNTGEMVAEVEMVVQVIIPMVAMEVMVVMATPQMLLEVMAVVGHPVEAEITRLVVAVPPVAMAETTEM